MNQKGSSTARSAFRTQGRRLSHAVLFILLAASAFLIKEYSLTALPLTAPDELAHFSLILHVAKNPGEYPIRFETVRHLHSERTYNYIIHPPLYYYLMASSLRLFDPAGAWKTLEPADKRIENYVVFLRRVSVFLSFAGLYGLFLLFRYLTDAGFLRQYCAPVLALLCAFIPAHLHVAGVLNNDVMAWALWPFLAYYAARFYLEEKADLFWKFLLVFSLCLASKATLWPLALGLLLLPLSAAVLGIKGGRFRSFFFPPREAGRGQKIRISVLAFLACAALILALIPILRNAVIYGSFQPSYWKVYGLDQSQSVFYKIPPEGLPPQSVLQIAAESSRLIMKTTTGIVRHGERFYGMNEIFHPAFFAAAVSLFFIPCALCYPYARTDGKKKMILLVYLSIPAGFAALFAGYSVYAYYLQGMYGANGRYFIGYFQLFFTGLMMLASASASSKPKALRIFKVTGAAAGTAMLLVLFFRPFFYLEHSFEKWERPGYPKEQKGPLSREKYSSLDFEWRTDGSNNFYKRDGNAGISSYPWLSALENYAGRMDFEGRSPECVEVRVLWDADHLVRGKTGFGIAVRPGLPDAPLPLMGKGDSIAWDAVHRTYPGVYRHSSLFRLESGVRDYYLILGRTENGVLETASGPFHISRILLYRVLYRPAACSAQGKA